MEPKVEITNVFTCSLWTKDIDGVRKYAFRCGGKQLSPLFDSHDEAQEWSNHNNIILGGKEYAT